VEVKPGSIYPVDTLKRIIKTPKWAIRFGALKNLDAVQLSSLLRLLFPGTDLIQALTMEGGRHSGHLQSYIVGLGYENLLFDGEVTLTESTQPEPEDDMLAELLERFEVVIADDIKQVFDELDDVMIHMPGKQGRMEIKRLLKADKRNRKKIGVAETGVSHTHQRENLVIFDDSGSMGEDTVLRLAHAVKALAMEANAHLVLVSNTARHWKPGEFTVDALRMQAEYGGTHYETLAPLMDRNWGVVVTIADWDSSWGAKEALEDATGSIELLLDISLVSRPTFLAECLEPLAKETRPLLVAKSSLTYDY
jgi:hypothetical protein